MIAPHSAPVSTTVSALPVCLTRLV